MAGRIEVWRGNILDADCDVIVNAANSTLMGGGGVDGAIHQAAGPELKEACRPLAPCPPGEVRVTEGFGLAPRLIFHTVGPVWRGGDSGEAELLASCYRNCLDALLERDLNSIAFPAISTGAYGFPADDAARIAVRVCREAAAESDCHIILCAFDAQAARHLETAVSEPHG